MKDGTAMKILVTGKGSYIGSHIKAYLDAAGYEVDEVDTLGDDWQKADYSRYDSVIHVAAIVHQSAKGASEEQFLRVNTELPVKIAGLAKESGVSQFIFLSTMGVYGRGKTLSVSDCVISGDTPESAVGGYGGSKPEAEKRLRALEGKTFKVAVIRPPNVYGPGCKGNYIPLFQKLAMKISVCPYAFADVRQSMLYIDNLSELVRLIVQNRSAGLYLPQDEVAPNMPEMIHIIRAIHGKKTRDSRFLGAIVRLFHRLPPVRKLYGGIMYDNAVSDSFSYQYRKVGFREGMKKTLLTKEP